MGSRWIRRAGSARLVDGSLLLWSIAEGGRGARWRASTRRDEALLSDILLEVGHDGRPKRLEIATTAGQLTLHPEADETSAHGNVVTPAGVRHLAFPWSPGHWFESSQAPIVAAAMCRALAAEVAIAGTRLVPGLHVDDQLHVWQGQRLVRRLTATRWLIEEADRSGWELSLDGDGLPILEAGDARDRLSTAASIWPLELGVDNSDDRG